MQIINATTNESFVTLAGPVAWTIQPGQCITVRGLVVNGQSDSYTGERAIVLTESDGTYSLYETSNGAPHVLAGMEAGFAIAATMVIVWAVVRGLRPRID